MRLPPRSAIFFARSSPIPRLDPVIANVLPARLFGRSLAHTEPAKTSLGDGAVGTRKAASQATLVNLT
eukprot:4119336-Prymnesium_polylepis.1